MPVGESDKEHINVPKKFILEEQRAKTSENCGLKNELQQIKRWH